MPKRSRRRKSSTVTIRDVARASGFSSTTVSFVLNDAPLARFIPAKSKNRIRIAAKKLGYRPHFLAPFTRTKRSHSIGVMVFDITDPFCAPILKGIENALYQASYLPILANVHNERSRFERYLEMLLDRRVEGLVVLANWMFLDINILADIEKNTIPAAMIGAELETDSISSVIVDNEHGGRKALEHLYALGHRKIAFICGPKILGDTGPRWKGVRSFAQANALALDPRLVVELPESRDANSGFEAGFRLTEELLKRNRPFTALMAFDDVTAFGAIRALTKSRLRVPEDCSVIGFDDVATATLYTPALTTIRQPMELMGSAAVGVLIDAINAGLENREFNAVHRRFAPELVVRESTKIPSLGHPGLVGASAPRRQSRRTGTTRMR